MPDALVPVLALPGLGWLIAAALLAGIVRGFAGFGGALIYLPVAAQFVSPLWAVVTVVTLELFGPLAIVPSALKQAHRRDLLLLTGGSLCLIPVGLATLAVVPAEAFRYILSTICLLLVACLLLGLRYRGALRPPLIAGVGGASGFLGGLLGVPGPPVVLFYMASALPVQVVRANVLLYLVLFDFQLLAIIGLRGDLELTPLLLGGLLALPGLLGNLIGAAVFNPDRSALYRVAACAIVALSAILALPAWD